MLRHFYISTLFVLTSLFYLNAQTQKDSIYLKNLDMYVHIIEFETDTNNERINTFISIAGKKLKYGKWKTFHENGIIASKGAYSIEMQPIYCGTHKVKPSISYISVKKDKWTYWTEQASVRTDLISPETPYNGYYRVFNKKNKLILEGFFKQGNLFTGKKYTYFTTPNTTVSIDSYENGKYLGKTWK